METFHCLIADIPQVVLADIVQSLIEESSDLDVIGRVSGTEEILSVVNQDSVDVLIMGIENGDASSVWSDIINKTSNMVVIGLIDDGRRLAVFLDNVGKNEIVKIITTFGQLNRKNS